MLYRRSPDAMQLDQAVNIARQFGPEVINAVAVMSPQQVMLEVRFIEISRTAGRELGFQWNRFGSRSTIPTSAIVSLPELCRLTGTPSAGVLSVGRRSAFALAHRHGDGGRPMLMINALEQQGVARSLAEPNLVALSGDTASFLAGGEYPIPVAGSLGQITVEYKKYGVGLAFTPTVLGGGLINLKIEPEVSEIDTNQHTVSVGNGISVPALIVRRASTTIELRDGQSFAIGGLLQNNTKNQVEQLPWLGSVPVLGTLFSSKTTRRKKPTSSSSSRRASCIRRGLATCIKTPTDKTSCRQTTSISSCSARTRFRARSPRQSQWPPLRRSGHMLEISAR